MSPTAADVVRIIRELEKGMPHLGLLSAAEGRHAIRMTDGYDSNRQITDAINRALVAGTLLEVHVQPNTGAFELPEPYGRPGEVLFCLGDREAVRTEPCVGAPGGTYRLTATRAAELADLLRQERDQEKFSNELHGRVDTAWKATERGAAEAATEDAEVSWEVEDGTVQLTLRVTGAPVLQDPIRPGAAVFPSHVLLNVYIGNRYNTHRDGWAIGSVAVRGARRRKDGTAGAEAAMLFANPLDPEDDGGAPGWLKRLCAEQIGRLNGAGGGADLALVQGWLVAAQEELQEVVKGAGVLAARLRDTQRQLGSQGS